MKWLPSILRKRWIRLVLYFLAFVSVSYDSTHYWVGFMARMRKIGEKNWISVPIPYFREFGTEKAEYEYQIQMIRNSSRALRLRITPDDCVLDLKINNQPFSLAGFNPSELCDYERGFYIDLPSGATQEGVNFLQVHLKDEGGAQALRIQSRIPPFHFWSLIFLFGLISVEILLALSWSRLLVLIFALGIFAHAIHLRKTEFNIHTWDVLGHLDHINLASRQWKLPDANACWECHQMPLYYSAAAGLSKLVQYWHLPDQVSVLQAFSFFIFMIFLGFGLSFFRILIQNGSKNSHLLLTLSLAFILWPTGYFHSARISNDILFYLFFTIAAFYSVRWLKWNRGRDLIFSCIATSLCTFTKINGVLGVFFFIGILAWKIWEQRSLKHLFSKTILVSSFILLGTLVSSFSVLKWKHANSLTKAEQLASGLKVGNELKNYLGIDFPAFLKRPWVSTWDDESGRNYFLNFYLKSSVLGEFAEKGEVKAKIAQVLSYAILLLALLTALGVSIKINWLNSGVRIFLVGLLVGCIGVTAYYRLRFSYACNQDFRYFYTAIIPILFFGVLAPEAFPRNPKIILRTLVYGSLLIIIGGGALLYLLPNF